MSAAVSPYAEEMARAREEQRDHVVRCACGGCFVYTGYEFYGLRAVCGRCRRDEVRIQWHPCTECDAMFVTYEGPDPPPACPLCRSAWDAKVGP